MRVALAVPVAVLFAACARENPLPAAPAPAVAVTPPRGVAPELPELPELERERLSALFEAAALVARRWERLRPEDVCVLLVAQSAQWVANCAEAPAGFRRTVKPFRDRPVFAHVGTTFGVGGRPRSTAELLAHTPAAAHVFGPNAGERPLPARHPWLLLGTLEALREFHPAFGPAKTEHWLSVAMHEFVHFHQLLQPSFAPYIDQIDSGALKPAALRARYESDAVFRGQIEREYRALTLAAARALDARAARQALGVWLRSYQRRSALVARRTDGEALLRDERLFMYLEGVARFVESEFLVDAAQHPRALKDDPQFFGFEAFVGRGYSASPNRQLDPDYYYAIGYHLCVLLERVEPDWHRRVDGEPGWLIGVIERVAR